MCVIIERQEYLRSIDKQTDRYDAARSTAPHIHTTTHTHTQPLLSRSMKLQHNTMTNKFEIR